MFRTSAVRIRKLDMTGDDQLPDAPAAGAQPVSWDERPHANDLSHQMDVGSASRPPMSECSASSSPDSDTAPLGRSYVFENA
jgi:hypothetical protein